MPTAWTFYNLFDYLGKVYNNSTESGEWQTAILVNDRAILDSISMYAEQWGLANDADMRVTINGDLNSNLSKSQLVCKLISLSPVPCAATDTSSCLKNHRDFSNKKKYQLPHREQETKILTYRPTGIYLNYYSNLQQYRLMTRGHVQLTQQDSK